MRAVVLWSKWEKEGATRNQCAWLNRNSSWNHPCAANAATARQWYRAPQKDRARGAWSKWKLGSHCSPPCPLPPTPPGKTIPSKALPVDPCFTQTSKHCESAPTCQNFPSPTSRYHSQSLSTDWELSFRVMQWERPERRQVCVCVCERYGRWGKALAPKMLFLIVALATCCQSALGGVQCFAFCNNHNRLVIGVKSFIESYP